MSYEIIRPLSIDKNDSVVRVPRQDRFSRAEVALLDKMVDNKPFFIVGGILGAEALATRIVDIPGSVLALSALVLFPLAALPGMRGNKNR